MAFLGDFAGFGQMVASPAAILAMGGGSQPATGVGQTSGTPSLLAPSGPSPPQGVATTLRGTGSHPITPSTVEGLFGAEITTPGMPEFLENLGAAPQTPADVFFDTAEEDLTSALAASTFEGAALTPIQRAAVAGLVRKVFESAGFEAPRLGTVPRRTVAPPTTSVALPAPTPGEPLPSGTEIPADVVNLSQVVDQALKGHTRRLTFNELADYRLNYERVCGCAPAEEHTPTSEQLAGLRAVLAAGRVPFVDFAVWSALGPRLAKFRRTEASVLVGSEFVSKTLDAPPTHGAWEESFQLFAVAMVSLNVATPGALSLYLTGIRHLLRLFPGRWPAIAGADLVVRSERWLRMREDLERTPPPGVDMRTPWDYIISASAFGRGGPNEVWWSTHLVLPLTVGAPLEHAGLPTQAPASSASSSSRRGQKRRPAVSAPESLEDTCRNFNTRFGACARDGPCPHGRRHVCNSCGGRHRACDVHSSAGSGDRRNNDRQHDRKNKGKGKGHGKARDQDKGKGDESK